MHDVIGKLSQHAHCAITPQRLVKSPKSILPFHWLPDHLSADVSGMSQLWEDSLMVKTDMYTCINYAQRWQAHSNVYVCVGVLHNCGNRKQ